MGTSKNIHLKAILFLSFFFALFIMLFAIGHYSMILLFLLSFFALFTAGVLLDIFSEHIFSPNVCQILSGNSLGQKLYRAYPDRKLKLLLWLLITLSFAPAYIALFPGTFGYDAPIQAAQYFGELELTSANPLLHTYLLGTFLSFGETELGDAALGFALFILIQGLLATQALAKSLLFLKKIHAPFTAIVIGLLWVLCNPTLHALTFNATKDVLFGILFLHFLLNLLEILFTADLRKSKRKTKKARLRRHCFRLFLSGILMCLMRNAAIYLVASLIFVLLFARPGSLRTLYKKVIFVLCTVFLAACGFSYYFENNLKIPSGDSRENMSVPIQQLSAVCYARAYNTETTVLSDTQLDAVLEIIPVQSWDILLQDTVDPVKSAFRTDVFFENPTKYISLYIAIGRQNPGIYIRSFRNLVYPYLNMEKSVRRGLVLLETFPGLSHLSISRYGFLPTYSVFLSHQVETEHYFPPMQPGISIYLLVIGGGISFQTKNRKMLLCILPLSLYFIGLLLGPVALLRYLYPMMLATPLLFGVLFWKKY